MEKHIDDPNICRSGCNMIISLSIGNVSIQGNFHKKKGLDSLLEVLEKYIGNEDLVDTCCSAIEISLSGLSLDKRKDLAIGASGSVKILKPNTMSKAYRRVQELQAFLNGNKRNYVTSSISHGVCTKRSIENSTEECRCGQSLYCPKCCFLQKAFKCLDCDKGEAKFYCETCWQRYHKGHSGEEYYFHVKCSTECKEVKK